MKQTNNSTRGSLPSGKRNGLQNKPNTIVTGQSELTILLAQEVSDDIAKVNYQLARMHQLLAIPIERDALDKLINDFSKARVLDKDDQPIWAKEVCRAISYKNYCQDIVIEAVNRLRADGTADSKAKADDNAKKYMPTPPQFVEACELVLGEAMRYVRQHQRKLREFEILAKQADDDLHQSLPKREERILTSIERRPRHIARLRHEIANEKAKLGADMKRAAWGQTMLMQQHSDPARAFVMPTIAAKTKQLEAGFAQRQAEIEALEKTLQWLENEPLPLLPPPADDAIAEARPVRDKSLSTKQPPQSSIRATDMPKVIRLLMQHTKVLAESERELVMVAAASEPSALTDEQRNQLTAIARRVAV
jgi:hypothetical protein